MAAAIQRQISLAKSLDPRLLRFFKKFPPPQVSMAATSSIEAQPETIQTANITSSMDPNEAAPTSLHAAETPPSAWPSNSGKKSNPFLPFRNPSTGNWHPPTYSLRRQAVLYKLARAAHVLPLMPVSPKHPEVKEIKRIEQGLRVKGTGVGQKVKGKKWERTMRVRLEERRKAMENMPEMIRLWKERGHGRGWKRWPK